MKTINYTLDSGINQKGLLFSQTAIQNKPILKNYRTLEEYEVYKFFNNLDVESEVLSGVNTEDYTE